MKGLGFRCPANFISNLENVSTWVTMAGLVYETPPSSLVAYRDLLDVWTPTCRQA